VSEHAEQDKTGTSARAAKRIGSYSKQSDYVSKQSDYVSKQSDYVSKQSDYVSKQGDYVSKQSDYVINSTSYTKYSAARQSGSRESQSPDNSRSPGPLGHLVESHTRQRANIKPPPSPNLRTEDKKGKGERGQAGMGERGAVSSTIWSDSARMDHASKAPNTHTEQGKSASAERGSETIQRKSERGSDVQRSVERDAETHRSGSSNTDEGREMMMEREREAGAKPRPRPRLSRKDHEQHGDYSTSQESQAAKEQEQEPEEPQVYERAGRVSPVFEPARRASPSVIPVLTSLRDRSRSSDRMDSDRNAASLVREHHKYDKYKREETHHKYDKYKKEETHHKYDKFEREETHHKYDKFEREWHREYETDQHSERSRRVAHDEAYRSQSVSASRSPVPFNSQSKPVYSDEHCQSKPVYSDEHSHTGADDRHPSPRRDKRDDSRGRRIPVYRGVSRERSGSSGRPLALEDRAWVHADRHPTERKLSVSPAARVGRPPLPLTYGGSSHDDLSDDTQRAGWQQDSTDSASYQGQHANTLDTHSYQGQHGTLDTRRRRARNTDTSGDTSSETLRDSRVSRRGGESHIPAFLRRVEESASKARQIPTLKVLQRERSKRRQGEQITITCKSRSPSPKHARRGAEGPEFSITFCRRATEDTSAISAVSYQESRETVCGEGLARRPGQEVARQGGRARSYGRYQPGYNRNQNHPSALALSDNSDLSSDETRGDERSRSRNRNRPSVSARIKKRDRDLPANRNQNHPATFAAPDDSDLSFFEEKHKDNHKDNHDKGKSTKVTTAPTETKAGAAKAEAGSKRNELVQRLSGIVSANMERLGSVARAVKGRGVMSLLSPLKESLYVTEHTKPCPLHGCSPNLNQNRPGTANDRSVCEGG
jgi:hypothetical protein